MVKTLTLAITLTGTSLNALIFPAPKHIILTFSQKLKIVYKNLNDKHF